MSDPLAPVQFTIAGQVAPTQGWQTNDAEGGYDQASGIWVEEDWRGLGEPSQGEILRAYSGGRLIWAGRLNQPPQTKEGLATFAATGFKTKPDNKGTRLFIQSADMSQWVPADSDPHFNATTKVPVYDHHSRIELESGTGHLKFAVPGGQSLATGVATAFAFYAQGVQLSGGQVRWFGHWIAADDFAKLDIRIQRANGPAGAETNITTIAVSTANRDLAQSTAIGGTSDDLLLLGLHCNDGTFAPNAARMRWMLRDVRVNSAITTADTYNASDVVTYIGTQMGWTTTGVVSSTFNALPFDWQDGSWFEALLYVAELEDKAVRIGDSELEYADWGSTAWTVSQTGGADPDLKPLELFNQARVTYESSAGVERRQTSTTTTVGITDPLAASGITNVVEADLADRQRDSTLASLVADKMVRRYARQRYAGTVDIATAYSTTTDSSDPRAIRYGDTVTIQEWAPGESLTLRVMEVSQGPDSVRLGVEQPVNIPALIAHTSGRRHRRRRSWRRGR